MKKKEVALALALLSAVSSLCLKGMRLIGEKLSKKDSSFADIDLRENQEES